LGFANLKLNLALSSFWHHYWGVGAFQY